MVLSQVTRALAYRGGHEHGEASGLEFSKVTEPSCPPAGRVRRTSTSGRTTAGFCCVLAGVVLGEFSLFKQGYLGRAWRSL